jgi:hypothetical protein
MNKKYLGYGLAVVGVGYLGYYFWGLSTVKDRAKVTKVDIVGVGLTWIKLQLTIVNFSTVSVPFNGASGMVNAQGFDISDFYLNPQSDSLPAGSTTFHTVEGSINWSQLAGLIPNVVNLISNGKWKEVITQLQPIVKGDIYSGNLSASFSIPLV